MRYLNLRIPIPDPQELFHLRSWLPSRGNVLFTLLVVAGLLWAQSAGALPLRIPSAATTSTGTIAYQGRLADSAGTPLTGTYGMIFRLYDAASGGAPLWEEQWTGSNGVQVSDGLFNVMLGSITPIPQDVITTHDSLFLGITVGTDDEMTPRVQLGSVPFAVQALTVPDGSVSTAKLANGAVTSTKIQDGAVTQTDAPSLVKASNGNLRKIQYGRGTISDVRCAGIDKYCADITLPEPFRDTNYSVAATPENRHGLRVINKTTTGFRVITDNDFPGLFEFDWIAVGR